MTAPQEGTTPDPLEQAMRGRMLLVISCDEHLNLEMEENTFPGWAIAGVADWLALVAEATMSEEMTEEADDDPPR